MLEENIKNLRPGLTAFPEHVFVDDRPWLADHLWPFLSIDLGLLRDELAGTVVHMVRPVGPIDGCIGDDTVKFHNEYASVNWFALYLTDDNRYRFLGREEYFVPYSEEYSGRFKKDIVKVKAYAKDHGRLTGCPTSLDGEGLARNWLDSLGGDFWAGNWIIEAPPRAFELKYEEDSKRIQLTFQGKPFFPVATCDRMTVLMFYEPESRTVLFTFDET